MQTDLFGAATLTNSQSRSTTNRTDFLERYRFSIRLDQALVGFIGLLVIYVMIFSFGVEKGKKFALAELRAERDKHERVLQELRDKIFANQAAVVAPAAPVKSEASITLKSDAPANTVSKPIAKAAPVVKEQPVSEARPSGKFTIQIVTFTSKAQVDKEFKRLTDAGREPFTIGSGKFHQVCVDSFETRLEASKALKVLKDKGIVPKDAYVRVVPTA